MPIQTAAQALSNNGTNGFKNKIINGGFNVWQRGTSFSSSWASGLAYNADRFWFYGANVSSGTLERSTDVPANEGFAYSLFNNTNGEGSWGTSVELSRQGDVAPFKFGKTYTFSIWTKGTSAVNKNIYFRWRNAIANGTNNVDIDVSKQISIGTTWSKTEITFTINASPNSNNTMMDIEIGGLPPGTKVTGLQLEEGGVATGFDHRPIETELALCQRYYEKIVIPSLGTMGTYMGVNTRFWCGNQRYAVPKRTTPTVTVTADYAYFANFGNFAVEAQNSTGWVVYQSQLTGVAFYKTRSSGNNTPSDNSTYGYEGAVYLDVSAEF